MWYCSRCKEHVEVDKKTDLWTLPPILVIHFKRFQAKTFNRTKITKEIQYPTQELSLEKYVVSDNNNNSMI